MPEPKSFAVENPKDAIGATKCPLELWPDTASAMGSIGLLNGMLKYGLVNWRAAPVRASVYLGAVKRHLAAYINGEENDPKDGSPHLGSMLASLAIIVDAMATGTLIDDRPLPTNMSAFMEKLTEEHVARLKEFHKDKNPKHWRIDDAEGLGR